MQKDAKGVYKYLDSAISALNEVHAEIKSTKNSKEALEEQKAVRWLSEQFSYEDTKTHIRTKICTVDQLAGAAALDG